MATLRTVPDRSGGGPTRPPEHLIGPVVESFVQPSEVASLEEAELLAEARFHEEMDAFDRNNAHRTHEIVVPIIDAAGYEDEVVGDDNPAYSGLTVAEGRALLLNLAPPFRDRRAFEEAMRRGAP